MKFVPKSSGGLLLMLCLVLSGCSSTIPQVRSGFLGDYSQLKQSEQYENTRIYQAPGFDRSILAQVTEIKLVPFEVWINQSETGGINTEQWQRLHHYFHATLKQALQPNYRMVTDAGENTLTIRGAFSGVKFSTPDLSVMDLVPFRVVLNAGKAVYLLATEQREVISQVSIETEFLLGPNPNLVFAMTATKQLGVTVNEDNSGNFAAVTEVLDLWVAQFIEELAQARKMRDTL